MVVMITVDLGDKNTNLTFKSNVNLSQSEFSGVYCSYRKHVFVKSDPVSMGLEVLNLQVDWCYVASSMAISDRSMKPANVHKRRSRIISTWK